MQFTGVSKRTVVLVLKGNDEPPPQSTGRWGTWFPQVAGSHLGLVFALLSHPQFPPRSLQLAGPWGSKLSFIYLFAL